MLEIMILICRLALATTGMLDGHRTKSINLPALRALWRMVEWGLHPEIATHWSQQRAKPAGGKLSASSCGSRTSWLGAVTKATQSRCSPRHQPEPSPYTSSVPQHQHTSRAGLVPAHPATSLPRFSVHMQENYSIHTWKNKNTSGLNFNRGRNLFYQQLCSIENRDPISLSSLSYLLPLLPIYLLCIHAGKNPILSLLNCMGCRQDGKEVTPAAPNWLMYCAKSDYRHQTGDLK